MHTVPVSRSSCPIHIHSLMRRRQKGVIIAIRENTCGHGDRSKAPSLSLSRRSIHRTGKTYRAWPRWGDNPTCRVCACTYVRVRLAVATS
jgi:hypothetical protein